MADVALRVTFDGTTVDFYDYEVLNISAREGRNSLLKKKWTGLFNDIRRTGFGSLTIKFMVQSSSSAATSTLSKLQQLEESDSDEFYLYPKYVDDNTLYYRCVLLRGQIPEELGVAGYNAGRKEIEVEFYEVTKV